MDLILPAAGSATRMRGIPKFLLPVDNTGISLIEKHISDLSVHFDTVYIPTNENFMSLVKNLENDKVRVLKMKTNTMTETVLNVVDKSNESSFAMVMPDTFFQGENPINHLLAMSTDLQIAAWEIREDQKGKLGQIHISGNTVLDIKDKVADCQYLHFWGALSFNHVFIDLLDPIMPHLGYAIPPALKNNIKHSVAIMNGKYFDCGTPSEYFSLITKIV
jgi:NDP-sugar pyrophosphorylase family protein